MEAVQLHTDLCAVWWMTSLQHRSLVLVEATGYWIYLHTDLCIVSWKTYFHKTLCNEQNEVFFHFSLKLLSLPQLKILYFFLCLIPYQTSLHQLSAYWYIAMSSCQQFLIYSTYSESILSMKYITVYNIFLNVWLNNWGTNITHIQASPIFKRHIQGFFVNCSR